MAFLVAALTATPAYADRIDGEWCSPKGSLRIEGPKIRTPAGTDTTGRYTRHAFAYEPPPGDSDTGQMIVMQLLSEELMKLAHVKDGMPGPWEEWHRCNVTS